MKNNIVKFYDNLIFELHWIPPGEYGMGSPEYEEGHDESESPQHTVRITRGFWMGTYPVTQQQWQAVMGSNPSKFQKLHNPGQMVSWNDVERFLERLNELHGGEPL